jgi:hypothetical protein
MKHLIIYFSFLAFTSLSSNSQNLLWDWSIEFESSGNSIIHNTATSIQKFIYAGGTFEDSLFVRRDTIYTISDSTITLEDTVITIHDSILTFIDTLISSGSCSFISKFDSLGHNIWTFRIENSGVPLIAPDQDGNIYIACTGVNIIYNEDTLIGDQVQPYNVQIMKLNPDGHLLWNKNISGNAVSPIDLFSDFQNNVVLCCSSSGDIFYEQTLIGNSVASATDLFKLNENGILTNSVFDPLNTMYTPTGFAYSKTGRMYMTGTAQGEEDFGNGVILTPTSFEFTYIVCYDSNLNTLWAKGFSNTSGFSQGDDIAVGGNSIFVCGMFFGDIIIDTASLSSFPNAGAEGYLAKLDSIGNVEWLKKYSSNSDGGEEALQVVSDDFENAYLLSIYSDSLFFENDTIVAEGSNDLFVGTDIFLAKTDSIGTTLWTKGIGPIENFKFSKLSVINNQDLVLGGTLVDNSDARTTDHNIAFIRKTKYGEQIITSISKYINSDVKVYPNPFNNILYIYGNNINHVSIYNLAGKKVLQKDNINNFNSIATDGLEKGIYLIEIIDKSAIKYFKKLVKN